MVLDGEQEFQPAIVNTDLRIKVNAYPGSIHIDVVKKCYKSIPNQDVIKCEPLFIS